MGRMFRIITEGSQETVASMPAAMSDRIPYVEIGGPEGLVSSETLLLKPLVAEPPLTVPTLVNQAPSQLEPRVLSVQFHRFPKLNVRLLPTGVAPELVTYHFPEHAVSAEYQYVIEQIRNQFEAVAPRVLLFTSGMTAAGTTTVLMNLAIVLAQRAAENSKILVIDSHRKRPGVAHRLDVPDSPGLVDVLNQTVPLAWALQATSIPNLHILATGTESAPLLHGLDTGLISQLRTWFEWILIDGGLWSDYSPHFGSLAECDAVYPVTRQSDIERPEFTNLRTTIATDGGKLRGYITTNA